MQEDLKLKIDYSSKREEVKKKLLSLIKGKDSKQIFFVNDAIKGFESILYQKYGGKEARKCALFHALIGSSLGFKENNEEFSYEEARDKGIVNYFDFPDEEYSVEKFIEDLETRIEKNSDFAKKY